MQKMLSTLLAILLFVSASAVRPNFAQTQNDQTKTAQTKLSRADLFADFSDEKAEIDFEKRAFKSSLKQNKLSGDAKIALLTGGIAAVIIIALLATRDDDNASSGGCGAVRAPCPPGCVCIQ